YWDPDPEMFHIALPFLNRGILWYGFFFAFGFFIGYWIFLYLVRRYFIFFPELRKEDIVSWSELIRKLKAHPKHYKPGEKITEETKQEIMHSLRAESAIPEPRSSLSQRLLSFARSRMASIAALKKRL